MSKDVIPAVVTNDENSGVYLVVVPDRVGSEKSAPTIVLPGQSSDQSHESIDALAAFSMRDGKPIDLQLLRMSVGEREGGVANWWKFPDGSRGTVRMQDGKPVLDMDVYVPYKGPTPSNPKVWHVDELPRPAHLDHKQQGASLNDQLQHYLQQHYAPSDVMRVLGAVNEKIAALPEQESSSERNV